MITAFVLKRQDFGETDTLLTLFSLENGLSGALAKGARKMGNHWRNAFAPFAKIDFECAPARTKTALEKVCRAEKKTDFFGADFSAEKLALASFAAELCMRFCPEHHALPQIFALLEEGFSVLATTERNRNFPLILWVKFFTVLGVLPSFTHCGGCGKKFAENARGALASGVFCEACKNDESCNLDFNELKILAYFQRASFASALAVTISPHSQRRLFGLLQTEIKEYAEKPLKSLGILEELGLL